MFLISIEHNRVDRRWRIDDFKMLRRTFIVQSFLIWKFLIKFFIDRCDFSYEISNTILIIFLKITIWIFANCKTTNNSMIVFRRFRVNFAKLIRISIWKFVNWYTKIEFSIFSLFCDNSFDWSIILIWTFVI